MSDCCNAFLGCDGEAEAGEIECPTCRKFGSYHL